MPKYTDKKIEEALVMSRGMMYVAANVLGCSPKTVTRRVAKSKRLQEVVQEQSELILDTGELKLVNAVMEGDIQAIKYLLGTKGKKRGYVERIEIDNINVSDLTFEQLEAIAAGKGVSGIRVEAEASSLIH